MDHNDKESLTKELQEIKEIQAINVTDSNGELTISSNATYCRERFLDIFATDWRNILNDSSASDIIVLVRNSRHIWVHKLVFYVRCTNILLDVISNDTEFSTAKEKICWNDIDYDVALAFLEFIYCGTIDKHSKILDFDTSLLAIRSLARKYKVNDLFVYLRQKKFEFNLAKPEHIENVIANAGEVFNVSESDKFACKLSPNHTCNDLKSTQCYQETLLPKGLNNILQSPESSYVLVEDTCILENKGPTSMKLLKQVNFRNNTSTSRGISISPDMFDDTPDVIKVNDKSVIHSKDHDDSNIHMLLGLIKQDADISICSQKLTRETDDAKFLESSEDISTCLKKQEQNMMEIDLDSDLNSLKTSVDSHKGSLVNTSQSSNSKTTEEYSSNATRQKGNLTVFIEKIQAESSKSDSDLDSDLYITTHPNKMSQIRHSNPFCIYKWDDSDNENTESDNFKQSSKTRKKLGKLSMIEQRMRSFADKNPDFYSVTSNAYAPDVKQTNSLSISLEKTTESSQNDTKLFRYLQNISTERHFNNSNLVTMPSSTVPLPYTKTTNQSLNESIYDLEANEREGDDAEISMYSKYMRNRHDSSIAKYRTAIKGNISDSNLSDESILSDVPNKDSDTNEDDTITQPFLTQRNIIVWSDTEVGNVSSIVDCPGNLHNEDLNHKDYVQLSKKTTADKQDTEDKASNYSLNIENVPKAIDLENQNDINNTTKIDQTKFSINNRDMIDTEDIELNMIFTQTRSNLNESNKNEIDNHREGYIPSPIMVSSSPDLNMESTSLDTEDYNEHIPEVDGKSRKSTGFSFNFEDDIYLANVNVDKYEKHNILQKNKSTSVLNVAEFKKDNSRKCSNKNNRKNIINDYKRTNNVIHCEKLDRNITTLTRNSTSIRKLKRKSLSEGQISINRVHDQKDHASVQFQYNYSQNIGNIKPVPKITDTNVTPPPDYDGMETPELHVSSLTINNCN